MLQKPGQDFRDAIEQVLDLIIKIGARPIHIDMYESTIAYILDGERNTFYAIDVGRGGDSTGEDVIIQGMKEPRQMKHFFKEASNIYFLTQKVCGFKLGHFGRRDQGQMKVVFWNRTNKFYLYAFNPRESEAEEENELLQSRDYFEISENFKKIIDLGVNPLPFQDYDAENCEILLVLDSENCICLLKGQFFGKFWSLHSRLQQFVVQEDRLHFYKFIQASKILGVEIENSDQNLFFITQIIDIEATSDQKLQYRRKSLNPSGFDAKKAIDNFKNNLIVDELNLNFIFPDASKNNERFLQFPISNETSHEYNKLIASIEEVRNTVASHRKIESHSCQKVSGLLYNDFIAVENYVILIHGLVVSIFDTADQNKKPQHLILGAKEYQDYYNFDFEPKYVWMQDKQVKYSDKRWKIIVYFKNQDIKQLKKEGCSEFKLEPYLNFDDQFDQKESKLPGKIIKVLRNRNSLNQPVYFVIRRNLDNKVVLASVSFARMDYREFEIPGILTEITHFVILDSINSENYWQEVACFTTTDDGSGIYDQELLHIKIRVADFNTRSGKAEIIVLNKQNIPDTMSNIQSATDTFVSGDLIYFVQEDSEGSRSPFIDVYNLKTNSFTRAFNSENVTRLKVFSKEFFYWRTQLGGEDENKYISNIYFDGIQNIENFSNSNTSDFKIFSGMYPHRQKIHYDITSDCLAFFANFNQIKIIPFLHSSQLKLKLGTSRQEDDQVIATKYFKPCYIVTLRQSNLLQLWSMVTGKFMSQTQCEATNSLQNFEGFQCNHLLINLLGHQRISDQYTLLKSKEPIALPSDRLGINFFDSKNGIEMFIYKIIELNGSPSQKNQLFDITVKVVKCFIGPGIAVGNYGLYVGSSLETYIFYFQNSQRKIQLMYLKPAIEKYTLTNCGHSNYDNQEILYFQRADTKFASPDHSFLSKHSLDFKNLIINDSGSTDYSIIGAEDQVENFKLPINLCSNTNQPPKFISNDKIIFMSEDKIVKCLKIDINKNMNDEVYQFGEEEFIMSHCHFPGAKGKIDLATQIMIGSEQNFHLIGENCLTYNSVADQGSLNVNKQQKREFISLNIFNEFFLADSVCEKEQGLGELKFIKQHFKSKFELDENGILGYYFTANQIQYEGSSLSSQLYLASAFSFYQWRLLNLILKNKVNITLLCKRQIKALSYCQLINGSTLLHYIYKDQNALDHVFTTVANNLESGERFYLPLLKDGQNRTALDCTLAKDDSRSLSGEFQESESYQIYRKQAEIILQNISLYPFNLFKIDIKNLIPVIVEKRLMGLESFFDGCLKSPEFLQKINRGFIKYDESCGAKVFEASEVWAQNVEQNFKFQDKNNGDDQLLTIKIMDIPYFHQYKDNQDMTLMLALACTENKKIFDTLAIKALIGYIWPLYQKKLIVFLLIPYTFYVVLVSVYTIQDLITTAENRQKDSLIKLEDNETIREWLAIVFRIMILTLNFYFVCITIFRDLFRECVREQVKNIWHFFDIVPLTLILFAELMILIDFDYQIVRSFYALTSLLIWTKYLLLFKMFEKTNYLIILITATCRDLIEFLFIFMIAMIAFGQGFYIFFLNHNQVEEVEVINLAGEMEYALVQKSESQFHSFTEAIFFSYQMSLGFFTFDQFDQFMPIFAWMLFVLATVIVIFVMFNLLISLVGATFSNVLDNHNRIMYQKLAWMIVKNDYLLTDEERNSLCKCKYLMVAIPENELHGEEEKLLIQLQEIKQAILDTKKDVGECKKQQASENEKIRKDIKALSEKIDIDMQSLQSQIAKL